MRAQADYHAINLCNLVNLFKCLVYLCRKAWSFRHAIFGTGALTHYSSWGIIIYNYFSRVILWGLKVIIPGEGGYYLQDKRYSNNNAIRVYDLTYWSSMQHKLFWKRLMVP